MKEKEFNTPKQLVEKLKESIVGQDDYLQDLCTSIWMHCMRKKNVDENISTIYPKLNMLVLGKSGTGKTSAIQALAEELQLNMVIEDASLFTGSGWKGRDVGTIIRDVCESAANMWDAQFSIVVLDEIDKVFGHHEDRTFSALNNLLKMMEGGEIRYEEGGKRYSMYTDDLLFICLGAFDGLEDVIKKRMNKDRRIGFSSIKETEIKGNIFDYVTKDDLVAYGTNKQFLGRMGIITATNELRVADYKAILTTAKKSPIHKYDNFLYKNLQVHASITETAVEKIAQSAVKAGTGARELFYEVTKGFKSGIYQAAEEEDIRELQLDYLPQEERLCVNCIRGKRDKCESHVSRSCLQETQWENISLSLEPYDFENIERFTERIVETVQLTNAVFFTKYRYGEVKAATYLLAAVIQNMMIDGHELTLKIVKLQLQNIRQSIQSDEEDWETRFRGYSMDLYQKSIRFEKEQLPVITLVEELLQEYCLYIVNRKNVSVMKE